jgi:hypothetical protein
VESQPKISTTFDALCELHKCGASLEIIEKEREIIKNNLKTKVCVI